MTFSVTRLLLCLLACALLGACETISEKRKIDYKSTASRTLPPLEVPPDLSTLPETSPFGGTPSNTYSAFVTDKRNPVVGNQGEPVLPVVSDIRVERDGQARWLVAQASPEALWPRVREFVSSVGLIVERENSTTGVIETDWAENHATVGSAGQLMLSKWLGTLYSAGTRDKFRIRLERGVQPGTTEIYLAHHGMQEVVAKADHEAAGNATRWEPRKSEPDIEAEMLRLLIVYLGKTEEQAKTIVAQAPALPPERAQLARNGDKVSSLALFDPLDRAWRRVGLSLDRSGFTVEDRDRSKGVYYVRYIDPDAEDDGPGFFARLFGAEAKKNTDQYQIHLNTAARGTEIAVKNKDGAPDTSKTGERILTLLYEQLK